MQKNQNHHTSKSVEQYWRICKYKNCTRAFQNLIKLRNHEDYCQARASGSQNGDKKQSDFHRETPCNIILQLKEIKISLKRIADSKIRVQKPVDEIRPKRSCTKMALRKISRMAQNTDHCRNQGEDDDIEVYNCPSEYSDDSDKPETIRPKRMMKKEEIRLTCPFCDRKFTDMAVGNRHIKRHTAEKSFKCRFCDKSFTTSNGRKYHEIKIHKREPLAKGLNVPCLDCGRLFYSGSNLNHHLCSSKFKIIEPEIPITEMITSDAIEVEVDPFADTGNNDPLGSNATDESNSTNRKANTESSPGLVEINIRDIMRVPIVHEADDSIDIKYVTEDDMIGKRNDVSKSSDTCYEVIDLKCRVKDEFTASTSRVSVIDPLAVAAETTTEIDSDVTTFVETSPNPERNDESSTNPNLKSQPQIKRRKVQKSKQRLPNAEGKFQCDHCEQTFSKVLEVNAHEKSHLPPRTYPCDFPNCGKIFRTQKYLYNHKKVHSTESRYKCNFCDKKYRQPHGLKIHIRIEHTAEKPFKCEHCDQAFVAQQRMKLHVLRHHIKKPFKCKWCDHRCFVKEKMDSHERLHTGEKPYNCTYCNKSFRMQKRKREHELIHIKQHQLK